MKNRRKSNDGSETGSFSDLASYSSGKTGSEEDVRDRDRPEYVTPVIAKREQIAVARTKFGLGLVLLLTVAAVATSIYFLIRNEEDKDFEVQFINYASEIISVSTAKIDNSIETAEGFSLTLTSLAEATNQTWPFVSVHDYAHRAQSMLEVTGAGATTVEVLVEDDQREEWEAFASDNVVNVYSDFVEDFGDYYFGLEGYENFYDGFDSPPSVEDYLEQTSPAIFYINLTTGMYQVDPGPGPYLVGSSTHPIIPNNIFVNYNAFKGGGDGASVRLMIETQKPVIVFLYLVNTAQGILLIPIFDENTGDDRKVVGDAVLVFDWVQYFENILDDDVDGSVTLVMFDDCRNFSVTLEITGSNATFVGEGDMHDTTYDYLKQESRFVAFEYDEDVLENGQCVTQLRIEIYPTEGLESSFRTSRGLSYALVIILIFAFTAFMFGLYDYFVNRRQKKFLDRVIRQDKIMENVFPAGIRDKLFQNKTDSGGSERNVEFLDDDNGIFGGAPLAELYPSATVIFADISGFTAWSSAREPPQVFLLLETLYGAFDKLAYNHNVYKVETVGDCYVAAAGLPEPDTQHPVYAARFARDLLEKMTELTCQLEIKLGPDTTDLQLRIGINSGQLTAGVLRGERARFQLFGDTMNVAERMESTASPGRIQLSRTSADLLREHGKSKWIVPRRETVFINGKGEMQTYWLLKKAKKGKMKSSTQTNALNSLAEDEEEFEEYETDKAQIMTKEERLVEWSAEVLATLIQQIVAARTADGLAATSNHDLSQTEQLIGRGENATVLDEFKTIIELKRFNQEDVSNRRNASEIDLGDSVKSQLRKLLVNIADMYRDNSFHNFEHAAHVTASVRKLLTRIVSVDDVNKLASKPSSSDHELVDLAGHSYGITSDPLTQFAVVFSAIIHDLDHPGVPNTQLVAEQTRNAKIYKKSIAEQNSVDLTWELLMSPDYIDLRRCIYTTEEELRRFRQLVVNTVMATDIADKELQSLRKDRWNLAFSGGNEETGSSIESEDRKATIVIEHLIQASDVSHTMQHWHVFKQWNEKLFHEMYGAYLAGRAQNDPSEGWYKGEIGFFDFYVIPLAKKLESCGVFGVSSHEYLNYAQANRDEWARVGQSIVKEYLSKYEGGNETSASTSSSEGGGN